MLGMHDDVSGKGQSVRAFAADWEREECKYESGRRKNYSGCLESVKNENGVLNRKVALVLGPDWGIMRTGSGLRIL